LASGALDIRDVLPHQDDNRTRAGDNRHAYLAERVAALDMSSRYVPEIVADARSNVVTLTATR
jgi:hypothetical protein